MKYLGFVLLVLSGYVIAEEVYYCSDNHNGANGANGANGFYKNEKTGQYEQAGFTEKKFKMKLQGDGNISIANPDRLNGKDLYFCSTLFNDILPKYKNMKSCVAELHNGYYFNFNTGNGRYIFFRGHGYVFSDGDTVSTNIGTCTKF